MPNAVWATVALPRNWPLPGAVTFGGHLDLRRPPGDLDGEVVTGLGGQPGPGGLDEDTPGVGPELDTAWSNSHGPTVAVGPPAVYGRGNSPKSSRIRRRSRRR